MNRWMGPSGLPAFLPAQEMPERQEHSHYQAYEIDTGLDELTCAYVKPRVEQVEQEADHRQRHEGNNRGRVFLPGPLKLAATIMVAVHE